MVANEDIRITLDVFGGEAAREARVDEGELRSSMDVAGEEWESEWEDMRLQRGWRRGGGVAVRRRQLDEDNVTFSTL